MTNSTDFEAPAAPAAPVVRVPSAAVLKTFRERLDNLDRSIKAMRSLPATGDAAIDVAWAEAVDAYQAYNDDFRGPLDAEDWPALYVAVKAARARLAEAASLLCDAFEVLIDETEAKNAARSEAVINGGAA